jgi:hypothetical protein
VAPSAAEAVAAIGTVAGALYTAPAAGLVSATVGGVCAPLQTVPLTVNEVGAVLVPL